MAAQVVSFVFRLGSTAILARLLTPADFGLIAMVTAVTGFVEMFKDAGLSIATVQREQISHEQVSTLFWINVALSALLMLLTAALAPAVAWFYGEPRLVWITIALACTFLFGGLAVQHQALLQRQMRFTALAVIQVASIGAGVVAAIVAALAGLEYWSLVVMLAAQTGAYAILAWTCSGWRPGMPRRRTGVRPMLAFGGSLTGFRLMNYFARNADNVLIGWYWGPAALGLYSRAYGLVMLPVRYLNGPISAMAVPALSRLQSSPQQWIRYYSRAVSGVMLCTAPLSAFLFVAAEDVVLLVLGPQWHDAARIFRWLALSALAQPLFASLEWVYISLARSRQMLIWSTVTSMTYIAGFVVAVPFGATAVAALYSAVFLLLLWPSLAYACRGTSLRPWSVLRGVVPQTTGAVIATAFAWGCRSVLLQDLHGFYAILISGGAFLAAYAAIVACFPDVRGLVRSFMQSIRPA